MINVMRTVSAAAAIQAPAAVDIADTQLGASGATARFEIRDSFTGVFGNLASAPETNRREATFAIDR